MCYITDENGNNLSEEEEEEFLREIEDKYLKESEKSPSDLICTPKVGHFWRCIFSWAKQEGKIKYIVQNLK